MYKFLNFHTCLDILIITELETRISKKNRGKKIQCKKKKIKNKAEEKQKLSNIYQNLFISSITRHCS